MRGVLDGVKGPVRDIVLLNAAAALLAFAGPDLDGDLTAQLADQLQVAARAIDSGAAADALSRWVAASTRAAESA